jgi:hypothetical protein
MSDGSTAFLLHAYTQSYDWGKLGSTSKAAQYAQTANPSFDLDENRPYAEVRNPSLAILKKFPSKRY